MTVKQLQRTIQRRAVAENETLVRNLYRDFINGGDSAAAESALADSFMSHDPLLGDGRAQFIVTFDEFRGELSNFIHSIDMMTSDADMVWTMGSVYRDQAARDADTPFAMTVDVWRIADGQIVEHWDVVQELPMAEQSVTAGSSSATIWDWADVWASPTGQTPDMVFRGIQNGLGHVLARTAQAAKKPTDNKEALMAQRTKQKPPRDAATSVPGQRGMLLEAYLNEQIEADVTDDRSREDIIGDIADDSGDSPSVIREIVAGDIIRPDDPCLSSFASVLGVPMARLKELANEDWETHLENRTNNANRPRRKTKRHQARNSVQRRSMRLGEFLTDAVDNLVDDDADGSSASRADIVADLANAADLTTSTINQILSGNIMRPGDARLEAIADVLDLDVDELIRLADADQEAEGSERTADLESNIVRRVMRGVQKFFGANGLL